MRAVRRHGEVVRVVRDNRRERRMGPGREHGVLLLGDFVDELSRVHHYGGHRAKAHEQQVPKFLLHRRQSAVGVRAQHLQKVAEKWQPLGAGGQLNWPILPRH